MYLYYNVRKSIGNLNAQNNTENRPFVTKISQKRTFPRIPLMHRGFSNRKDPVITPAQGCIAPKSTNQARIVFATRLRTM